MNQQETQFLKACRETIEKLEPKPGDLLIMNLSGEMTNEQIIRECDNFGKMIKIRFPGTMALVLGPDVDISMMPYDELIGRAKFAAESRGKRLTITDNIIIPGDLFQ
jgi:hypothetical protein